MKKRILFVIMNLQGGGAEKVLVDLVNNLDLNKFEVTIFLLKYEGPHLERINKDIKIIYDTKNINGFYSEKIQIRFIKYFPKLYYWLKIKQIYDVEVAFLEGLPVKLIANSINKKSKKIGWIHSDLLENHWTKRFYLNLNEEIKCFNKLNDIVFVSNQSKMAFEKLFNENSSKKLVIYNPIILDDIIKKSEEENIMFKEFTIMSVGRLNNAKGFDRLIKAHKETKDKYPHKLIIIGVGEERDNLNKLIKQLKVENSVEIMQFQKNPYKYIKACDLFICSSRSEGFSLVVAEAIILEKPIISTRVTGPTELLNDGEFGIIVENSEEGIVDGINRMLTNKENLKYYSRKSRERKEFFDYKLIIRKVENILSK